jgi:hypothetical protein
MYFSDPPRVFIPHALTCRTNGTRWEKRTYIVLLEYPWENSHWRYALISIANGRRRYRSSARGSDRTSVKSVIEPPLSVRMLFGSSVLSMLKPVPSMIQHRGEKGKVRCRVRAPVVVEGVLRLD